MVTAPSSGAEVIPFLKTYVNLPGAVIFTVLYSKLCNSAEQVGFGGATISRSIKTIHGQASILFHVRAIRAALALSSSPLGGVPRIVYGTGAAVVGGSLPKRVFLCPVVHHFFSGRVWLGAREV